MKNWTKSDFFNLIQTIASIILIIGIITGIATLRISRNQQRFEIIERFSAEWNSEDFGKIQKRLGAMTPTADSLRGDIVMFCNFFERLGMYESEKIIDLEDVYKLFGTWPCRYWNILKDAIYEYRHKYNHPQSWENFERLCIDIENFEKRISKKEGK